MEGWALRACRFSLICEPFLPFPRPFSHPFAKLSPSYTSSLPVAHILFPLFPRPNHIMYARPRPQYIYCVPPFPRFSFLRAPLPRNTPENQPFPFFLRKTSKKNLLSACPSGDNAYFCTRFHEGSPGPVIMRTFAPASTREALMLDMMQICPAFPPFASRPFPPFAQRGPSGGRAFPCGSGPGDAAEKTSKKVPRKFGGYAKNSLPLHPLSRKREASSRRAIFDEIT